MMANQVAAVPTNALRNQPMFRTLEQEVTLESLTVTGQIPEWLSGTLFRNGPGQFAVGKTAYRHWFDGLAMLHAFAFQNGRVSYANKFIRGSHRTRELVCSIPVEHPAYMHSFALTEHYVVLTEFPFVVKPLDLAMRNRPFIENFRWEPERGTRIQVVSRADGKLVGTYTGPAFFAFHHVNAFEADGAICMDIAAYDNPSMINALYLDHPVDQAWPQQQLRRYRVPINGGPVACEVISPVGDARRRNRR